METFVSVLIIITLCILALGGLLLSIALVCVGVLMYDWLLKFNYAVEIGAHLAYLGHYERTNNPAILKISQDEVAHRHELARILENRGHRPSIVLNSIFTVIGWSARALCYVAPLSWLDSIALLLEKFAIVSYEKIANLEEYEYYKKTLLEMARQEKLHKIYFELKGSDLFKEVNNGV